MLRIVGLTVVKSSLKILEIGRISSLIKLCSSLWFAGLHRRPGSKMLLHRAACKHRECGPPVLSFLLVGNNSGAKDTPDQFINKAFLRPESNPHSMLMWESAWVCVGPAFGETEALFVTTTVGWGWSLGLDAKPPWYNRPLTLLYRRAFIPCQESGGQEQSEYGVGGGQVQRVFAVLLLSIVWKFKIALRYDLVTWEANGFFFWNPLHVVSKSSHLILSPFYVS